MVKKNILLFLFYFLVSICMYVSYPNLLHSDDYKMCLNICTKEANYCFASCKDKNCLNNCEMKANKCMDHCEDQSSSYSTSYYRSYEIKRQQMGEEQYKECLSTCDKTYYISSSGCSILSIATAIRRDDYGWAGVNACYKKVEENKMRCYQECRWKYK